MNTEPATPAQLKYLKKLGYKAQRKKPSKEEATQLIKGLLATQPGGGPIVVPPINPNAKTKTYV